MCPLGNKKVRRRWGRGREERERRGGNITAQHNRFLCTKASALVTASFLWLKGEEEEERLKGKWRVTKASTWLVGDASDPVLERYPSAKILESVWGARSRELNT